MQRFGKKMPRTTFELRKYKQDAIFVHTYMQVGIKTDLLQDLILDE